MKLRITFLFVVAAAAGSLLLSCEANGGSIYATIESEQKATSNTLPTLMTVADLIMPSTGTYYVAAGGIFQGSLNTSTNTVTWTPNNSSATTPVYPFNPKYGGVTTVSPYDLCNSLANFNGHFWGGFYTQSDDSTGTNNVGLVQFDVSGSTPSNFAVVSSVAGQQVTMLRAEGGYLFMSTAVFTSNLVAPTYNLSYSNDGTTWSTVSAPTGPNSTLNNNNKYPVIGMAYDGTNYWAVSENTIYMGSTPAGLSAISNQPTLASVTGQPTDAYNDISVNSSSHAIFVPTVRDGIYISTNTGASWTAVTTAIVSGSTPVSFLTVAGPLDPGTNTVYLAGSDGYGYYVLSTSAASLTRQTSTTILLYGESVSKIVIDSANSNVLMGTNANGVWRAQFGTDGNLTSSGSWTHESGGSTTSTS